MVDKAAPSDGKTTTPEAATTPPVPPKRGPGHRGADVRDTVAEMTAKAHEISLEAGSRMAAAMKDVINAAAGLTDFVLESARDLAQYMVRRGQMTQDEADKLIRQAEEAYPKLSAGSQQATPAPHQHPVTKTASHPAPIEKAKSDPGEKAEKKEGAPKKGGEKTPPPTKKSASKAPVKGGKSTGTEKPAAKKAPAKSSTAKKATTKRK